MNAASVACGMPHMRYASRCSCAGEFTLTGVWTSATQMWALSPGVWVTNPCGYVMVGYWGKIEAHKGLWRFSGSVTGVGGRCKTFSMDRYLATAN
jgi:hypothetical protein